MNQLEYQTRRKRLLDRMEEGSLALVFSGYPKIKSEDEEYPFEANRHFYYLTGIDQQDCVLMLVANAGERKEFLFVPPFDEVKAKWYGKRLSVEEAREISGVRNVLIATALQGRLHTELSGSYSDFGSVDKVYLDLAKENKIGEDLFSKEYADSLLGQYPGLSVYPIQPLMIALRSRKSKAEAEAFRAACDTTNLGIRALMAAIRPGVKEYELADVFAHVINDDNGYNGISFNTIIASGPHACTLHYPRPLGECKDGDLVLCDLGARHEGYCADVSRTFPVSGKFTPTQRKIYDIVLAANEMVAQMAAPGRTIAELQAATKNFLATECVAKGPLTKKEDIDLVYYHGISHHIGLDTHDCSDRSAPLEEGAIISDEPGLYFSDLGIGVRIEDDLLITKSGCEVLTKDILKDPDALEAFFASR